MKRMLVSLGLSATILLSAAFAQPIAKKAATPTAPATAMTASAKAQQSKNLNPKMAQRLGLNGVQKRAAVPVRNLKPILKHVAQKASDNPDKVTINLVVGSCWGDGSGYQMLLDKDAHLCDTAENMIRYGLNQSILRTYYDMADYKIPENASATDFESVILDNEDASIEIEAGVYDILVINPCEGDKTYIAGGNSCLDDFTFEAGFAYTFEMSIDPYDGDYCTVIGPYDLAVETLVLPVVGCEIGEEVEVQLNVTNRGTADAEAFTIWYALGDPEDEESKLDTIKQDIETKLESGKTVTYTFNAKISPVNTNETYTVVAGVLPIAGEMNLEDNQTAGCFTKTDGLTELPYEFDLDNNGFVSTYPGAWIMENGVAEADFMTGQPLVSQCFELEAGKTYRLSYDYWAGMIFFIWEFTENYHVGFGLTSEPISEWETVFEDEDVFVEDWETMDILLEPETSGTYAVYFSADMQGIMGLRNIMVTEVADKDARLNAFNTGLARLMPAKQVNGAFQASATVQNRGKLTMDEATVSVKMGETQVGTATVENLKADAIADVDVTLTINGLKAGDKVKFVATVNLDGEEEAQLFDNAKEMEIEVNDYVMAYDYVSEDMYNENYAIGASGRIGCGIPFTLVTQDTLTAVSLGWSEANDMMVGITIHKWNSATRTLGDLIYETEVRRGTTAGQRDYAVPSIILEAGDYMISAIQTGSSSYGLISDLVPGVGLYITTANPVNYQDNLGTPSIRAVFGPDANPVEKDVFVSEITKPNATGLFAENQEIVAVVKSNGFKAAQTPVSLLVNGKLISTKNVDLQPYGNAEVSFEADLSTPSTEYVLTVFSALEGDADITNDTCTKTINSLAPADPYVMDFEYCEDFAIDEFNPAWKTVDADGSTTYGFNGLTFPHAGDPFAFIAFNPEAIGLEAAPHGGERFGASFAAEDGLNNDWLISPKLKIVAGKEFMTFFVKTYMDDYGLEKYNVYVSTTDDKIESFEKIGATREAPVEDWTEVNIDLKEFSGKEVYLAIQCVSEDAFIFMIDDITVCRSLSNQDVARLETLLSVYPNPAKEMVTIHAQDAVINQVAIFNIAGMKVYQSNALNTNDYRYSVSKLSAGIYFARVTTDKGTAVMKFVVR